MLWRVALIVCAVHQHALASIQIAGILQLHHDLNMQKMIAMLHNKHHSNLFADKGAAAATWILSLHGGNQSQHTVLAQ